MELIRGSLDIKGEFELSLEGYRLLHKIIGNDFAYEYPFKKTHPSDVLYSTTGPYGLKRKKGFTNIMNIIKQKIVKPILGFKPYRTKPMMLAVEGLVLRLIEQD